MTYNFSVVEWNGTPERRKKYRQEVQTFTIQSNLKE